MAWMKILNQIQSIRRPSQDRSTHLRTGGTRLALLLQIPLLAACSGQTVDFQPASLADAVRQVETACSGGRATRVQTHTVRFDGDANGSGGNPNLNLCQWSQGGNLSEVDGRFRARKEQNFHFEIPSGSVICDVDVQFDEQPFRYDDHFLFAFNQYVLATSYNWSPAGENGAPNDNQTFLDESDGMWIYDWSKIADKRWTSSGREQVICAPGALECRFPGHDNEGQIRLRYESQVFRRVMSRDLGRTQHSFTLTVTGDNDSSDCWHRPLEFQLRVTTASRL
jgi:hypothetical protein